MNLSKVKMSHVCEEKISLPYELHDEAATWWYYDGISSKVLDTQGVQQARKDEIIRK